MEEELFLNEPYVIEKLAESDLFWAIVENDGWNGRVCIAGFSYENDARQALDVLKHAGRQVDLIDVIERHHYYQDKL